MSKHVAQLLRLVYCAGLALAVSGCARVFGSYDFAPNGLVSSEDRLRRMMVTGQSDALLKAAPPEDEVLRALYRGVLAYHAGDYAESARALDAAAELSDARITKSLSRSALSLVSNDMALPYEPGRTERLMIPYYAAMARVRLGDVEGAAVEARRLSFLLQHYSDDDARLDPRFEATLRYVASALFEANGNYDDGDVAYRNVLTLDSTFAAPPRAVSGDSGVVVLVLEQGFVAHRVEEGLAVMLRPEEVDAIADGGEDRATAAALVAGRVVQRISDPYRYFDGARYHRGTQFVPAPEHRTLPRKKVTKCTTVAAPAVEARPVSDTTSAQGASPNVAAKPQQTCKEVEVESESAPYLLKVAWPVYRSDSRLARDAFVVSDLDSVGLSFAPVADVSRGVVADFERERALIVARTIARGAAKMALTKSAEKKLEEKHEGAGKVLGVLGNLGNVLLERADTRSWHLLPGGLSVARVVLPAGTRSLTVMVDGRRVGVAPVDVRAGSVVVAPVRVF